MRRPGPISSPPHPLQHTPKKALKKILQLSKMASSSVPVLETVARGYQVAYGGAADSSPSYCRSKNICYDCAQMDDFVPLRDSECPRCKWFDWSSDGDEHSVGAMDACCCCGSGSGCDCHAVMPEEPVTPRVEVLNGVQILTLPDGRKVLSGNTFRFREQIKAASRASPSGLAAGWDAAEKTWTVGAGSDLSFLIPPPPAPKKRRLPFRGACCADARAEFDSECPQGPMLCVCATHGTHKDSYEGS